MSLKINNKHKSNDDDKSDWRKPRRKRTRKREKKAISKARQQAKQDEAKREAERRAEVKPVESNQRKQHMENITGERPTTTKETKSQRKQRKRLERQAERAKTQRADHERAHKKKNSKKARKEEKRQHRATKKEARRQQKQQQRLTKPKLISSALDENVQRWFISGRGYKIPDMFLNDTENNVKNVVDKVDKPKKVYTTLKCELVKHDLKTGEKIYTEFHGRSKTHTITSTFDNTYDEMKGKMLESLAKFQKEGSGWQLHSINGLDIIIVKFKPLSGSGYSKLPPSIAKKKAIINMKNAERNGVGVNVRNVRNPKCALSGQ